MHPESLEQMGAPPAREPALALLERRRRTLACAALVGALGGALAAQLLPPWYESTARLVVVPVDDPTSGVSTNALDLANATLPMVVAVLRSARVTDTVVARLDLARAWQLTPARAARRLHAELDVATDRKSNLVTVSFEDHLPRRARDIVAVATEEATALGGELWSSRNRAHRLRLQAELSRVQTSLRAAEAAMRQFRERTHVVDLTAQVKASVEQAASLERLHIDKALGVRFARGYGDGEAIEVRKSAREREAVARELSGLRHDYARPGPLLALDELPALEVEHARLKRALDELGARNDLLALKVSQLEAAEARPGGRAEIIDPAVEPSRRAGPSLLRYGAVGAVALALLAAVFVLSTARRRPRLVVQ